MFYSYLVQTNSDPGTSVKSLLAEYISGGHYSHVYAAMAYVTISGIRDVLELVVAPPEQTRWVIGLDDALTQPGALELCISLPRSYVRVASFEHENRRFHPKILYLSNGLDSPFAFMMLGSTNLTKKALSENAESVVFLHSETSQDKEELDDIWSIAWNLGRRLAAGELAEYKQKYSNSKKHRRNAMKARIKQPRQPRPRRVRLVLDDDHAEIDPTTASTCWIECGNVTAMGRELEFKAEQGLFFGLDPHGEAPKHFRYLVSDGSMIKMRMKYQGNHMWRLQMTNDVPEVAKSLRPLRPDGKLGRSPWVAVFNRTRRKDIYKLRFVRLHSKEHKTLRQRSTNTGTHGKTTAREYGWF